MSVTLVATAGAADANSYATVAEAQAYFDTRVAVAGWDDADDQAVLLMMATRLIDATFSARRTFVKPTTGVNARPGYFENRPTWTGTRPVTNLSRLAWPREGMYDRNGTAIASTVIPQELKDATAELAGALGTSDTTVDNDVAVQGITSIKAGPVALTFAEGGVMISKSLPESVLDLLLPSWFTDLFVEGMFSTIFEVVSD